jgi:hypothetical protein
VSECRQSVLVAEPEHHLGGHKPGGAGWPKLENIAKEKGITVYREEKLLLFQ